MGPEIPFEFPWVLMNGGSFPAGNVLALIYNISGTGSIKPSINLARVDLPEPDSPTIPNVSDWYSSKDTSSTAWTYLRA